jgi:rRNA small subunit pseudouridine methyltransferase Nep1
MESLVNRAVLPGVPLLKLSDGYSFKRCLEEIAHSEVIVLAEQGTRAKLGQRFQGKKDLLCVIGGFPRGDFRSDVYSGADDVISVFDEPLTAWTVTSELIVNYENALDL